MKLVVFSHKLCWRSEGSPTGFATDGGFPFQMRALSELFEATSVVVPCTRGRKEVGEVELSGHRLSIVPLTVPPGSGLGRKLAFPFWLARNAPRLAAEIARADAVHTPIPGDVGTVGMVLAFLLRKPLFVRHCGNWFKQRTVAEHAWKWFMERFAGDRNVFLATGGSVDPPSSRNSALRWIFSTTLSEGELRSCDVRERSLPAKSPRLIIVCRQERLKGSGIAIESLPLVLEHFPEASLTVVGEGAALQEFKQLAVSVGVAARVTFPGKVDHPTVLRLLREADIFCYPTRASEGFPKVVHEALACGLPVITTRVSVLPQLIGTGCGYLLDEATPDALAAGVRECFTDPERYRALSTRAVETAREYSLERWRDTIGDFLRAGWGPLQADA